MKRFNIVAAQGEIIIRRVGTIPKDCEAVKSKDGTFSIAPSDNGHNHVIDAGGATVFKLDKPPAGMRILYAVVENATALRHLRRRHTHAPIPLDPGMYEFRIAREYNPYADLVVVASEQEPPEARYNVMGDWIWQWLLKGFKSTIVAGFAMRGTDDPGHPGYNEMGTWIWQWLLLEKWLKSTRASKVTP
jgi:hypothetical protein